jgi:hypothetical protein
VEFPFQNTSLTKLGLTTPWEQYALYGSVAYSTMQSIPAMRKAYFLNKYVHETNLEFKKMWGGRANFSTAELEAAPLFLKHYKSLPRKWALLPLSFVAIEVTKLGVLNISKRFKSK